MKILLINPIYPDRPKAVSFPLGLAYVASALIRDGNEVELLDISGLELPAKETSVELSKRNFDIAGIGGLVTTYGHIKWLLSILKKIKPDIPLVVGGGLASSLPDLVLEKTCADIVVIGEGEITMVELVRALKGRLDLSCVKGIYYKSNGCIKRNPTREAIMDLDSIPFPAWDLFSVEKYVCNLQQYSYYPERVMMVLASRSCPFRCNFCYHPLGQTVRTRSARNIVEEIKTLTLRYGIKYIWFCDELFTVNKKQAMEFCSILNKERIDIKWQCAGRVNNADLELYQEMKKAGCVSIQFGIESGNNFMLKAMQKDATVELSEKGINIARRAGIEPETSYMIGTFGEDESTIKDSINFIKRNELFVPRIFFTTPYPRSPIYDESLKKGLIKDEEIFLLKLGNASSFTINLTALPDRKLIRFKKKAEKEILSWYFRQNRAKIIKFEKNQDDISIIAKCLLPACNEEFTVNPIGKAIDIIYCSFCSKPYYLALATRIRIFGPKRLLEQMFYNYLQIFKSKLIVCLPYYKQLRREKYWLNKREFFESLRNSFLRRNNYR